MKIETNKKKILSFLIMVAMLAFTLPLTGADTTEITGSFNPSTTLSANLWNSSFNWSVIGASSSSTKNTQLNNTGDVNIDVSIQETSEASDLYHSTNVSAGTDEYLLEFNMEGGGFNDITRHDGAPTTLEDNVPASGQANNYTNFDVRITMGSDFSSDFGWQSNTITVTYTEHT